VAERSPDDWVAQRRTDGAWELTRTTTAGHDRRLAHAVTDEDGAVWVSLDGEVVVVPGIERVRRRAVAVGSLEAPMPAQVTAVLVAPGDDVGEGATLVLLDAMKMELPLTAPRAARVTAVHCAVGDRVAPGRALVDLDHQASPA